MICTFCPDIYGVDASDKGTKISTQKQLLRSYQEKNRKTAYKKLTH